MKFIKASDGSWVNLANVESINIEEYEGAKIFFELSNGEIVLWKRFEGRKLAQSWLDEQMERIMKNG